MERRRREGQKAWLFWRLMVVPVVIAAFFQSYVMSQQNDPNQEEKLQTGDAAS